MISSPADFPLRGLFLYKKEHMFNKNHSKISVYTYNTYSIKDDMLCNICTLHKKGG